MIKIPKQIAQTMRVAGLAGLLGTAGYFAYVGHTVGELKNTPAYQAARRIDELSEGIMEREAAIDDCLNAHPQEPDACLSTVTDYFEYAEQANAERAQLESFPGYQAAAEEMEQWHGQLPWFGAGFLCFFTSLWVGNEAYSNRKAEEAAQQEKAGGLTINQ